MGSVLVRMNCFDWTIGCHSNQLFKLSNLNWVIDDNQIFVSPLLTPRVVGPEATWKIINLEQYPTSVVSVYNRYGLVVFEKRNYQNDWAGIYQKTGELLPAGSYYYVVKVLETGKVKKGWLYLTY